MMDQREAVKRGYPYRGPHTGAPTEDPPTFWNGWWPSKLAREAVDRELMRLWSFLGPRGWELGANMFCRRQTSWDAAIAMLHIYVNGCSCGYTLEKDKAFFDVPDKDKRWYDLRICANELPETRDTAEFQLKSPGPLVAELIRRLPQHVDDLIEHFRRY